MNKKITITAIMLLLLSGTSVFAQGNGNGDQEMMRSPEIYREEGFEPKEVGEMERMMEQVNNPEIGEQVRVMSQNQARVQQEVQESLSLMTQKSKVSKFFFGPDYKNASRLRENIQKLRDDANTLSDLGDESVMMSTSEALNQEADALENELNTQLAGFSLFGWIAKIFAKY